MGCRIQKKYTLQQGKEENLMLTADFGSLQMRLTTQDTSINPSTFGNCDPGLYDIYKSDTECPDAHSNTLKIVFMDSVGGQLYDLEMEDGSHIKLYQDMSAKVNRDGKEQIIKVSDLRDTDDFLEPIYDF